jgi:hypothetical protein
MTKRKERYQIVSSTDRKFIGREIDRAGCIADTEPGASVFVPTQVVDIGEGYIRLSNSNYSIEARKL